MRFYQLFFLLVMLSIGTSNAQTIKGKVLSKKTNKPVFSVAIKTENKTGTVTNDLGLFSIDIFNSKQLIFSCLGFKTTTVSITELQKNNYTVYLQENIGVLDEIKILASAIHLDSVLIKTQKQMRLRYIKQPVRESFYSYANQKVKPTLANVELKRTNLLNRNQTKKARAELDSLSKKYGDKPGNITEEFLVSTTSIKVSDEQKNKKPFYIKTEKASGFKKNYIDESITVDQMDKIFKNTLLKYLDTTKTYKVTSGLFTVDKEVSFQKITEMKDSVENDNSFVYAYPSKNHIETKNEKTFFLNNDETNFLSRRYYNHALNQTIYRDDKKLYTISFYPKKNKSKFSGDIEIDAESFLIHKINYSYAEDKRGTHINLKFLLGVKFSEDGKSNTIHYKTTAENFCFVNYFKEEKKSYAYISRPLKFSENKGWFQNKDKIKVDFTFEVNFTETKELLYEEPKIVVDNTVNTITKKELDLFNKQKVLFLTQEQYEQTVWKNRLLIEQYFKTLD